MADLTSDAPLRFWPGAAIKSEKWVMDTSAAQTIYKGQPVILDVSADTVYVAGFVTATTVAPDDIFIGIAAEQKAVTLAAPETTEVEVYTWPTIVGFKSTVYTDADVGDTVYMSDSATLSSTAADNPMIGKLHRVADGYAYVQLSSPTICAGA